LSTAVDYRVLLVVMATVVLASAGYLVTRRHDESPAPAAEQLLT
jgi:hypothetical protein